MEHLFYHPAPADAEREYAHLKSNGFAVPDWDEWDRIYGPCPHVREHTQWYGFNHDLIQSTDCSSLSSYARNHGLNADQHFNRVHEFQAKVYMGLLEAFFGHAIGLTSMTRRHPDGRLLVYTRLLTPMIQTRLLDLLGAPSLAQALVAEHLGALVKEAVNHLGFAIGHLEAEDYTELLIPIHASITQLLNTIQDAITMIGGLTFRFMDPPVLIESLRQRLVNRAWCPAKIRQLLQEQALTCLRWLDGSEERSTVGGHEHCTDHACEKDSNDIKKYRTAHRTPDCHCASLGPDPHEVARILSEGTIPVVKMSDKGLHISAVSPTRNNGPPFTAFSHVWSDGLGSVSEHGLPQCQLVRLSSLAAAAEAFHSDETVGGESAAWFWIDAVCVPAEPTLRRQAIGLMTEVYTLAARTVVIDNSIRCIPANSPWPRLSWAIVTSSWAQRLWTYHEGMLSKRLLFEFSDGLMDFNDFLQQAFVQARWSSLGHSLSLMFSTLTGTAMNITQQIYPEAQKVSFSLIANAIRFRSTSKSADELVVVTSLMGLDVKAMMLLHDEERCVHFFEQVKLIPWPLLFDPGPKLTEAPFRWAPKTFMTRLPPLTVVPADSRGMITGRGLEIQATTLKLSKPVTFRYSDLQFSDFLHVGTRSASICHIWCTTHARWMILGTREPILDQTHEPSLREVEHRPSPWKLLVDRTRRLRSALRISSSKDPNLNSFQPPAAIDESSEEISFDLICNGSMPPKFDAKAWGGVGGLATAVSHAIGVLTIREEEDEALICTCTLRGDIILAILPDESSGCRPGASDMSDGVPSVYGEWVDKHLVFT